MKGLKNDVASLSYYSLLTNTISTSYDSLKKTIETKEYTDYIPDAWAGLIKVTRVYYYICMYCPISILYTYYSYTQAV